MGKKRLLVVDDEVDVVEFIGRALRHRFQITTARSGHEALEKLENSEFDVLISDQNMPEMSGIELLEKVGTHLGIVKVLLTGYLESDHVYDAGEQGILHAVVWKPVDSEALEAAIAQAYRVRDGAPFSAKE